MLGKNKNIEGFDGRQLDELASSVTPLRAIAEANTDVGFGWFGVSRGARSAR